MTKTEFRRYPGIDLVKGLSIIGVVLLHSVRSGTLLSTGLIYLVQPVQVFCLLLGMNLALFASSRRLQTMGDFLHSDYIVRRLYRLLPPLVAAALITLLCTRLLGTPGVQRPILHLLAGLPPIVTGPGDYFIAVFWQFIWLSPLLWLAQQKLKPCVFLTIAIALDLGFQLLMSRTLWGLRSYWFYRASILRYLTVIAIGQILAMRLGVFRSRSRKIDWIEIYRQNWQLVLYGIIGAVMLALQLYAGFAPFLEPWNGHNLLTFGFAIAAAYAVIQIRNTVQNATISQLSKPFEILGQASLHIFLIQMLYFHRIAPLWSFTRDSFPQYVFAALAVTIPVGLLFWMGEKAVLRLLKATRTRGT